jgi:hypothetical protein
VIGMPPGGVQSSYLALMVFTVHNWHHASRDDLKPYSMTLSGLTMRPLSSDGELEAAGGYS